MSYMSLFGSARGRALGEAVANAQAGPSSRYAEQLRAEEERRKAIEEERARQEALLQSEREAALEKKLAAVEETNPKVDWKNMSRKDKVGFVLSSLAKVLNTYAAGYTPGGGAAEASRQLEEYAGLLDSYKRNKAAVLAEAADKGVVDLEERVKALQTAEAKAVEDTRAARLRGAEKEDDRDFQSGEKNKDREHSTLLQLVRDDAAMERLRQSSADALTRVHTNNAYANNRQLQGQLHERASKFAEAAAKYGGDPDLAYNLAIARNAGEDIGEEGNRFYAAVLANLEKDKNNADAQAAFRTLSTPLVTSSNGMFTTYATPEQKAGYFGALGGTGLESVAPIPPDVAEQVATQIDDFLLTQPQGTSVNALLGKIYAADPSMSFAEKEFIRRYVTDKLTAGTGSPYRR